MEYNYYKYVKPECNLTVDKMPKWFREVKFEISENEGLIILNSYDEYDEIYGSNAKIEIMWEKKNRAEVYHAKEVQTSIDVYNAIGMVVISRENTWLRSHEFTYWYGNRNKMMRKRYYKEKAIHGVFYCDITERVYNIHATIIDKYYENFKPFILKSYTTVVCHE